LVIEESCLVVLNNGKINILCKLFSHPGSTEEHCQTINHENNEKVVEFLY